MTERIDVPTPDGRTLECQVGGPPDGTPLVFHHGTPGSGVLHDAFVALASERNLRTVMYSRPGYANSTEHHGRAVADCAADVAAILDAIGADTFVTVGWSGGGPHALACSALLKDRCTAAATIAGAAPYAVDDLDFMAGMAEENVEEFSLAVEGEEPLMGMLSQFGGVMSQIQGADIAESLGGLISDVDRAHLTGELADYLALTMRTGLANGVTGWRDDDLAFVKPWGFDLDDVGRVAVWQGDQDMMVPFAHGQWLGSHLPKATVRLHPGEGHLSIASGRFSDVLDDLL